MSVTWAAPRENAAMRGAGHTCRKTTHFRLSNPEWSGPRTTAESRSHPGREAELGSTSHGAGTADDPLIIS